jgi:hypothetical protein
MKPSAAVTLLVASLVVRPAVAETQTLESRGLWSAFGGAGDDGRDVCGIVTVGADGRRITIAQSAGETGLAITLGKDSWVIPDGTAVSLTVQFDGGPATALSGTGSGHVVTVAMPFAPSIPFMRALRQGATLRVGFLAGNEPAWNGGLSGSGAAIDAFNACRGHMAAPAAAPTQPFAAAPAAQPAALAMPTQPFATPPAAAPASAPATTP